MTNFTSFMNLIKINSKYCLLILFGLVNNKSKTFEKFILLVTFITQIVIGIRITYTINRNTLRLFDVSN